MLMSKEVGYRCPELKKAKAGDTDLAIFITWQAGRDVRKQPKIGHKNRGRLGKGPWKNPVLRGQAEEESGGRLKKMIRLRQKDEKTVMRNAGNMKAK